MMYVFENYLCSNDRAINASEAGIYFHDVLFVGIMITMVIQKL